MIKKQKQILLLIFLIILLFAINYSFIDEVLENFLSDYEVGIVERVIDGDTIVIENKTSVRLLGINSPEKGEAYYSEAKSFLENLILNKTVYLKFGKDRHDQYGRILAYIFLNNENINIKIVEKGFANVYILDYKKYEKQLRAAWQDCIKNKKNLCESSENVCASCIKLKEFSPKNQEVIFYNNCNFKCELTKWQIKDEGRKKFIFPEFILKENNNVMIKVGEGHNSPDVLFWEEDDYIWTEAGDTLFLRDNKGKLVLWESY